MRLIDADKLKADFIFFGNRYYSAQAIECVIDHQPTVDTVKHGHWIWMGEQGDSRYMCSVCKCKEDNVPTCNGEPTIWEYCPNCGAKMEEVEDAQNN